MATVARGGSVIDPAVLERLLARDGASPSDRIADLTDRELRLLPGMNLLDEQSPGVVRSLG